MGVQGDKRVKKTGECEHAGIQEDEMTRGLTQSLASLSDPPFLARPSPKVVRGG
jgi:hypothetical protein